MESVSSCRDSEGQCDCVASGFKHLHWRVRVAAVHSGVKLQLRGELPVVQAQTDPKPQAPGLWWQLLHRRCKEGGRRQLLVPSWEVGEQLPLCGCQPADHAQCVRWAAAAATSSALRLLLYAHGDTKPERLNESYRSALFVLHCTLLMTVNLPEVQSSLSF